MSPFSFRKLGVGFLYEGLDLSHRFKEPLLVTAGAVVARELEHVHRVVAGSFFGVWLAVGLALAGTERVFTPDALAPPSRY